jgi:hypothetical protein
MKSKWILFFLPVCYVILSVVFLNGLNRFYINHYDPSYPYLFNGVNLASGHFRVGNVEHPGTPVDIFAAKVIFIKHLFSGNTILYQDVLTRPESYLFTISVVLILLLFLISCWSGLYIYRHTNNIGLAILFQSAPLFYGDMIGMTVALSTESFITLCGLFFASYLYVNSICEKKGGKASDKSIILYGLFTALLFTTKIYCFPIVFLVFFLIKEIRGRVIYLCTSGLFILLLLFPLYNQLKNWLGWIKSMVFHSGSYGQGNSGIIDYSVYTSNIIDIFTSHFLFSAIFSLVFIALIVAIWNFLKKKSDSSESFFHVIGLALFFTIVTFVLLKQYKVTCQNPLTNQSITLTKYYYFIQLFTFFPFAIAVSYKIISPLLTNQFFQKHKQRLFYVLLTVLVVFGLLQTLNACLEVRINEVSISKTKSFVDKYKDVPLILIADGGNQIYDEPALFVGAIYSGKWDMPGYFDFLRETYPLTYIYAIGWDDKLTSWGKETDMNTILKKKDSALLYISGADSLAEAITLQRVCYGKLKKDKAIFKRIFSTDNNYEHIYLIKTDTAINGTFNQN